MKTAVFGKSIRDVVRTWYPTGVESGDTEHMQLLGRQLRFEFDDDQSIRSARRSIADPKRRILLLMVSETIDIQLTPEERMLLMRYGYPFEQIEQALTPHCQSHRLTNVGIAQLRHA